MKKEIINEAIHFCECIAYDRLNAVGILNDGSKLRLGCVMVGVNQAMSWSGLSS